MWCLFGGHGWIGSQFRQILDAKKVSYEVPEFRMDDMESVQSYLKTKKPERVISFIGRTHGGGYSTIDYLELGRPQLVENVRDNLFAPVALAILCHTMNIHFTYLGTGCIFQYSENEMDRVLAEDMRPETGIFDDALPNFFGSSYSIVKGFTDRLMHLLEKNTLNLRIRMPITDELDHPRNFICKILKYEKICSIQNSMTVLPDILPIIYKMIKHQKTGTYNMCNPDTISHNDILDLYVEYMDRSYTYNNFSKEDQELVLKAGRSNNYLETSKLESEYTIPSIHESIERMFQRLSREKLSSTRERWYSKIWKNLVDKHDKNDISLWM
jgi:dTDP-4-dehydrorhamnose reductase